MNKKLHKKLKAINWETERPKSISADGVDYVIGYGTNTERNCCCSINANEMNKGISKICFAPDMNHYYVVTPEYYNSINRRSIEWLGECLSQFKSKTELSEFGYGIGNSPLEKYALN